MIRALSLAPLLALSGCFDMSQDFTFTEDGSASVNMVLRVDAALLALSENQGDQVAQRFCDDGMIDTSDEPGVEATAVRTTDRGDVVCTISIRGETERLVAFMENPREMFDANPESGGMNMHLSLTQEGEAYTFALSVPPMERKDEEDNPMAASMEQFLLAAMSGRSLEWSVTAPRIIQTSGTLSDDGRTASYSIPLATAFSNKTETFEFDATFSTAGSGIMDRVRGWWQ